MMISRVPQGLALAASRPWEGGLAPGARPTAPQAEGWTQIAAGKLTLIAAPTGRGSARPATGLQVHRVNCHVSGSGAYMPSL